MSVSTEDFIKSIYQLKFDFAKKASSSNLAEVLAISNAAVTDMAKKLSQRGLIDYQKYKEIVLTSKGKKLALLIIRRHRLWETFLSKVLDLTPREIHKEAENLEHQSSDYLISKIDEYLNFPKFDPHGDPIPDAQGIMPETNAIPLLKATKGKYYIISRLLFVEQKVQDFFNRNGIRLGEKIFIDDIFVSEGSVCLGIQNQKIILDSNFANFIHIHNQPE